MKRIILLLLATEITSEFCKTPDDLDGTCKPFKECDSLFKLRNSRKLNTREYIRRSECNYIKDEPQVCCKSENKNFNFSINSDLIPNIDVCGFALGTTTYIIGGDDTDPAEFPWMVLLDYKDKVDETRSFRCGGALINNRYVLTAAHCINEELTSVRLGEHDISKEDENLLHSITTRVDINIEEIKVFPSYDKNDPNQYHDIALLRLAKEVDYTTYIRPICLPKTIEDFQIPKLEKGVVIAGWGLTERQLPSSTKLKVTLLVQKCRNFDEGRIRPDNGMICAGGRKGKDSCKGDSGGPLMVLRSNPKGFIIWYAYGVLSIGPKACGAGNLPGIYTRVVKYMHWIVNNLKP